MEARIEIGAEVGILFYGDIEDEYHLHGHVGEIRKFSLHRDTCLIKIPDGPIFEIPMKYLVHPDEARARVPEPDMSQFVIPRLKHIRGHLEEAISLSDDNGVPAENTADFYAELRAAHHELSSDLHYLDSDPQFQMLRAISRAMKGEEPDEQDQSGEAQGEEAQGSGEGDQPGARPEQRRDTDES
jgi:hypothetical protein